MALLREIGGAGIYPLRNEKTTIGRSADCDVVLTVRRVSGRHAQVLRLGGLFFVEDLGSSNGTFVNGVRIEKRTALKAGARLEFFGTDLEFRDGDPDSAPSHPQFTLVESPGGQAAVMSTLVVDDSVRMDIAPAQKLRAVLEF